MIHALYPLATILSCPLLGVFPYCRWEVGLEVGVLASWESDPRRILKALIFLPHHPASYSYRKEEVHLLS